MFALCTTKYISLQVCLHWWRYNAVLRSRKSVISWHLLPGRSSQLLFIDFAGLYCASGVHYRHYWASRSASVALLGVDISLSPVKRMELLFWESSFLPFCLTSPVGGGFFSGRWRWRRWSRRRCSCRWSEFPALCPLQANRCKSTVPPQSVLISSFPF